MSSISQAQARPRPDRRQLMIAGGLGLLAAVLVIVFLSGTDENKTTSAVESGTVLSAALRIEAGDKITDEMVTTRDLPVSAISCCG